MRVQPASQLAEMKGCWMLPAQAKPMVVATVIPRLTQLEKTMERPMEHLRQPPRAKTMGMNSESMLPPWPEGDRPLKVVPQPPAIQMVGLTGS